MKSCLIFSGFIPKELQFRGLQYFNLIKKYYNDVDIYIGLNHPCSTDIISIAPNYFNNIKCAVSNYNLATNSDNSGYQKALELLKKSGKIYDIVYMTHTKSITHAHDYESTLEYIEMEFYKNRSEIEQIFNTNPKIGGWSFYGDVVDDIGNDMDKFYKFPYKSLPIMYWLTSYAIKGNIVHNFLNNCSNSFFTEKYENMGMNRYFFEAYFPQIISKSGYIPFFKHHYKNNKEKDKYQQIYDTIIKERF